jgi:hypothetical protein
MKRSSAIGISRLVLSLIVLLSSSALAYAYLTDGAVYTPLNYYTFNPPAAGAGYVDPAFGSSVRRISSARTTSSSLTAGNLGMVTNEYATMSPFNKDNSRLILQHDSYTGLYDGNGTFLKDLPYVVNAGSEPRWSKTDPAILYFVNGNQLKQIDVNSGAQTVIHTFSEYGTISGKGESDISEDGKHFVFAGDSRYVFIFDISTRTKSAIFDAGGRSFDSLYVTPNNNATITWYTNGTSRFNGIELFDGNMAFQRQVARAGGHMDIARDVNGDEVLLWANAADAQPVCQNGIVKIRLHDAHQTCLISLDWSLAVHVSAPDNNGWAFVETYTPGDPNPTGGLWPKYTNEIIQVRLDGSEVQRLAHHRSRPFDSYYYTPRASTSHDGTKIVFSSNYGLQQLLGYPSLYVDTYLINIGASTPASTPSTTPAPAPPSSPSPTPSPAPTPAPTTTTTTTRVEQNSSQVRVTGNWSINNLAVHSGSSAILSTNPNAKATFTFNGTGATWIGYRDEWSGIARVYVDGTLKGQVDTYASPGMAQNAVYSITGLPAGTHKVVVEPTGTRSSASRGSWVWVDAFEAIAPAAAAAPAAPAPTPVPTTSSTVTRVEQNSSQVVLTGDWPINNLSIHSGASAVLSMTPGSKADFTFNGTGANWIAYRDEWSGIARVYVDGTLLGQVDTYASPSAAKTKAYSVSALTAGTHTLTIEVTGTRSAASGGSWVWVDAFEAVGDTSSALTSTVTPATTTSTTVVAAPTTSPVRIQQNASNVSYAGGWASNSLPAHSGGTANLSMDAGSRVTLTFTGTAVHWIGYRDEWSGIATVTLDGAFVDNVDTFLSPASSQAVTYSLSNLSAETHTLTIEVSGLKNASSLGTWVWVDAFDVTP